MITTLSAEVDDAVVKGKVVILSSFSLSRYKFYLKRSFCFFPFQFLNRKGIYRNGDKYSVYSWKKSRMLRVYLGGAIFVYFIFGQIFFCNVDSKVNIHFHPKITRVNKIRKGKLTTEMRSKAVIKEMLSLHHLSLQLFILKSTLAPKNIFSKKEKNAYVTLLLLIIPLLLVWLKWEKT